jgi:putative ABC transport system permease protein
VDIIESFKMAGKTLMANRLRSALTMLGIIIGNASVIAMIGVGEGAQKYASGQFESLGTDVLFIIPGNESTRRNALTPPNRLTLADAEAIATQVPSVSAVAPQINGSELAIYGDATIRATVIGTIPSYSISQGC